MEYPVHTLLARTAHAARNYMRPYLSRLGLSYGQPKLLRCLSQLGPCSQRQLADACEVDPSAICRMLDNLERDGFLIRRPDPGDRRTGVVSLTDRGRESFLQWEEQCGALEDQMLEGFTQEERKQFSDFLSRAYRNMGGKLL